MTASTSWPAGQVCVVTGASSGIGLETARGFAERGAQVVLVCRSAVRADQAVVAIRKTVPAADLTVLLADLADQAAVRRLGRELRSRYPAVHVLVNNAGVVDDELILTKGGIELQFAVHFLAPFLLTGLLLDQLQAAAPGRVVNVASGLHERATPFDPEDLAELRSPAAYDSVEAYARSKLALISYTAELGRRFDPARLIAVSVEPGLTRTALLDNSHTGMFRVARRARLVAPSARSGAEHVLRLATGPPPEIPGAYYRKRKLASPTPLALEPGFSGRLWEAAEALTDVWRGSSTEPPAQSQRGEQ